MTEFFNALNKFKPRIKKPHTVNINGHIVTVSLDFKLKIIRTGIENWQYTDNKLIEKIKEKARQKFKELKIDSNGYFFIDNDPFWPTRIDKGGYTWQTPSE